jgi:hypothetical protein
MSAIAELFPKADQLMGKEIAGLFLPTDPVSSPSREA